MHRCRGWRLQTASATPCRNVKGCVVRTLHVRFPLPHSACCRALTTWYILSAAISLSVRLIIPLPDSIDIRPSFISLLSPVSVCFSLSVRLFVPLCEPALLFSRCPKYGQLVIFCLQPRKKQPFEFYSRTHSLCVCACVCLCECVFFTAGGYFLVGLFLDR